jgi:Zn-dependent protease
VHPGGLRSIYGVNDSAPPRRRPGRRRAALGRVAGIPVMASPSMIVLALLVMFAYGGYATLELGVPQPFGYAVGAGFVGTLLASVLLHELGHALAARRCGIGVRAITLELLGGYTELDRDAPTPRADLLVSLAGPAVSAVLGALAATAAAVLPDRTAAAHLTFQLALANLIVAGLNVLPGLPLDGGRALRAILWAGLHDRHRATVAAGWAGRGVAVVAATFVVWLNLSGVITAFGLVFLLLVSLVLYQGAGRSIRLGHIGGRFHTADLDTLTRPVLSVPAGTPLAEAQRRAEEQAYRPGGSGEPPVLAVADSAGRLVAIVERAAAAAVPPQRRPWVSVDSVARDIDRVPTLAAGLTGEQLIRAVQANPGAQYLVTAGEDVVGVLQVADLARLLEPRRRPRLAR